MRRALITLSLCLCLPLPVLAGIQYTSRTYQEGGQNREAAEMTVEGWVDGDSAKIVFQQSGNPFMPAGSYLVTTNGGQTVYLVNPEERTYSEWDLNQILQFAGGLLSAMGGVVSIEFENPTVETLLQEEGGEVSGLPTTHYRYRTTYDLRMKILGMKRAQAVEMVQDIWATDALTDAALGVWLRKEPPKSGNEDLDRLIELEAEKIQGFPLKIVEQSTMTGKKGKQTTTKTITEVTDLQRSVAIAPGTFEVPAGYTEAQMMPTAEMASAEAGEEEPQAEEKKGGLRSRLRKLRGKDDG